jgi:hypothetical protein
VTDYFNMRPARRKPSGRARSSSAPSFRPTPGRAAAALRRGREALSDIEGQLDSLMAQLREPSARIDPEAPDRLAGATRRAHHALAALDDLRRLLP